MSNLCNGFSAALLVLALLGSLTLEQVLAKQVVLSRYVTEAPYIPLPEPWPVQKFGFLILELDLTQP